MQYNKGVMSLGWKISKPTWSPYLSSCIIAFTSFCKCEACLNCLRNNCNKKQFKMKIGMYYDELCKNIEDF